MEEVKYTCPVCGNQWIEMEDPEDEWFRLGTNCVLCKECSKKAIKALKEKWGWKDEVLSGRTGSN